MRPEARKAAGYFPAAPQAIASLLPRLVAPQDASKLSIIDPCCGAGDAIAQLGRGLGMTPDRIWCIELDRQRGEETKARFGIEQVLAPCSFLQTEIRRGCFSVVYCNPPFDDSLTKGVRVEEQFLSGALQLLTVGGVLVFVCPEMIAERPGFRSILKIYAQDFSVVPFPAEVRGHKEVFVLATRIEGFRAGDPSWRDLCVPDGWKYRAPAAGGPGQRFKKIGLTDEELDEHIASSPLLAEFAAPPEFELPRPPLALGKGHLALLLAAGHLDGLVSVNGHSHVVRGTARKVEEVTDEQVDTSGKTTVTKTIYTERIKLQIRAVWPDGVIHNLE